MTIKEKKQFAYGFIFVIVVLLVFAALKFNVMLEVVVGGIAIFLLAQFVEGRKSVS